MAEALVGCARRGGRAEAHVCKDLVLQNKLQINTPGSGQNAINAMHTSACTPLRSPKLFDVQMRSISCEKTMCCSNGNSDIQTIIQIHACSKVQNMSPASS